MGISLKVTNVLSKTNQKQKQSDGIRQLAVSFIFVARDPAFSLKTYVPCLFLPKADNRLTHVWAILELTRIAIDNHVCTN